MNSLKYQAMVVGASAGGIESFKALLEQIGTELKIPVLVVQHIKKSGMTNLAELFAKLTGLDVREAEPNEPILPGVIYFAPADYHLAVEQGKTLTLLSSEPINYSRPSIDVLFESAAEVYKDRLIGLIMTGSSADGSAGLARVSSLGGYTIVQSPDEAEFDVMPFCAMKLVYKSYIGNIQEISAHLKGLLAEII